MTRFRGAAAAATAVLFVVTAIACYSAAGQGGDAEGRATTACDKPGNHAVRVGAVAVDCKEARVSKSKGNEITWRSDGGESIEIVFKARDGKVPFPDLNCPGNAPQCTSGRIAADTSGKYDYDIWLYTKDGKKPIDPSVIIDP